MGEIFTPHHQQLFEQIFEQSKSQLRKQLPLPKYLHGHFLDTFEDEWNALSQQPTINQLISDPRRILPPSVFQKSKNVDSSREPSKPSPTKSPEPKAPSEKPSSQPPQKSPAKMAPPLPSNSSESPGTTTPRKSISLALAPEA